jgi:hypothetical protein
MARFAATMQATGGLWWTDSLLLDPRVLDPADRAVLVYAWETFVEESMP